MTTIRYLAALSCLFALPAYAQDDADEPAAGDDTPAGEPASTEIKNLLDNIPQIENKAAPEQAEKPPADAEPIDFTAYMDDVRKAILVHWNPSSGSLKKHPSAEAQVLVKVDDNGNITEVGMIQPSGEKSFDKSVLKALDATDTVPAPVPAMAGDAARGIVVTFSARPR